MRSLTSAGATKGGPNSPPTAAAITFAAARLARTDAGQSLAVFGVTAAGPIHARQIHGGGKRRAIEKPTVFEVSEPMPSCSAGISLSHIGPPRPDPKKPAPQLVSPRVTSGGFFYFYERMGPRSMNQRTPTEAVASHEVAPAISSAPP